MSRIKIRVINMPNSYTIKGNKELEVKSMHIEMWTDFA
jgi:hypothetical protein